MARRRKRRGAVHAWKIVTEFLHHPFEKLSFFPTGERWQQPFDLLENRLDYELPRREQRPQMPRALR
jgi:hypothetical protein